MVPTSRGGIGVEAGTLLFGEEQVPHINFRLHCHRVAIRKNKARTCQARPIAVSRTILQKAMMRPRMASSSRVGALGRGRGHRP